MDDSKRVAIITRHSVSNYGSILQTYALQAQIEKMHHRAFVIDYTRARENAWRITGTLLKIQKRWNRNVLTRAAYHMLQTPCRVQMFHAFKRMREGCLHLSRRYTDVGALRADCPEADIYCTGSDQVWNLIHDGIDEAYFLSFLPREKKRIAYGASFGGLNPQGRDRERMIGWLERYAALSSREDTGTECLRHMGFEDAVQVLDPTLLLTGSEWCELIDWAGRAEGFILVYQVNDDKELNRYAKALAALKRLRLIRVTPTFTHFVKGGRMVLLPGLGRFLWYFKNAEYIVTDSFHATSFAINFNKKFVEILPEKNAARNQSLLRLLGLSDRIVTDLSDYSFADKPINYPEINRILERERQKSAAFLRKAIEV